MVVLDVEGSVVSDLDSNFYWGYVCDSCTLANPHEDLVDILSAEDLPVGHKGEN